MRRAGRVVAALLALAALALGAALALADPEPLPLAEARRGVEGQYAALPDGAVRYEYVARDPSRPLLVLVHGGILNSLSVWDPLVAALDGEFGVLRYDSYGQGYSARPPVRHDATLYVRMLDGLLEQAGPSRPVHLVGYSMGGLIAAEYAAHRPQRVASLTLIGPAGLGTQLRWPVRLAAWPVLGEAIYRLRGADIMMKGYELMPHAQRYLAHVREVQLPWVRIEHTGRSLLSQLRSMPVTELASAYTFVGASDVPVLAIFGEDDATVPPGSATALRERVPGARIEILTDSSHALAYEDAARIAPLLAAHVSAVERAAAVATPRRTAVEAEPVPPQ